MSEVIFQASERVPKIPEKMPSEDLVRSSGRGGGGPDGPGGPGGPDGPGGGAGGDQGGKLCSMRCTMDRERGNREIGRERKRKNTPKYQFYKILQDNQKMSFFVYCR